MSPFTPPTLSDVERSDFETTIDLEIHYSDHLTVRQAEDLLDWLEGHGVSSREVHLEADGLLTVSWRA